MVLPTFNRANFLAEAIESLLVQTLMPHRILVLDDGSTDQTEAIVARFGKPVEYLYQKNAGKSAALNRALAVTDEPYIWIFDDDDIAETTALENLYPALAERPDASFSFGRHGRFREVPDGRRVFATLPASNQDSLGLKLAVMERSFLLQPSMLVRRDALLAAGPFDQTMYRSQDTDMLLRLTRWGDAVDVDRLIFWQRQHSGTRGPAAMQISEAQRPRAWLHFNRSIFKRVGETYTLEEFLPANCTHESEPRREITARLHRFCVLARKGFWGAARQDLAAAVNLIRSIPVAHLDQGERNAFSRAFGADNGATEPMRLWTILRLVSATVPSTLRRDLQERLLSALFGVTIGKLRRRVPLLFSGLRYLREKFQPLAMPVSKETLTISPPPPDTVVRNDAPATPEVAAIMIVRNGDDYLDDALRSLTEQTLSNIEIIVVANRSDDLTLMVLNRWQRLDARMRIVRSDERGIPRSANLAVSMARAPFIARLDSDDLSRRDRLEKQLAVMKEHPEIGVLGTSIDLIDGKGRKFGTVNPPTGDAEIRDLLNSANVFAHSSVMFRREAFEAVGGYRRELPLTTDYDLWLRISAQYSLRNLPEPLTSYRIHDSNVSIRRASASAICGLAARAAAVAESRGLPDPFIYGSPCLRLSLPLLGITREQARRHIRRSVGRKRAKHLLAKIRLPRVLKDRFRSVLIRLTGQAIPKFPRQSKD